MITVCSEYVHVMTYFRALPVWLQKYLFTYIAHVAVTENRIS